MMEQTPSQSSINVQEKGVRDNLVLAIKSFGFERAGLHQPTPSCSVSSTLSDYVPDMTPFPGKSQKPQTSPPPLE